MKFVSQNFATADDENAENSFPRFLQFVSSFQGSETMEFKVQDIPSHLKEQFEGYFLEAIPSSSTLNTTNNNNTTINSVSESFPISKDVFDIDDVSRKLDEDLFFLRELLNKSGTGCAAVKQFTDHFDLIKNDQDRLETALSNFGANTLQSTTNVNSPTWNLISVDNIENASPIITTLQRSNETEEQLLSRNSLKVKKSIKKSFKVLPGQLDPLTGKRRKRSRCGTCLGCINRDKTQDCRECRNCRDQKRYGGPGRLKKACVKRSCIVMATPEGSLSSTSLSTTSLSGTTTSLTIPISLPIHPLSVTPCENETTGTTTAILSWPVGTQFTPTTFQIQHPVQFTYQSQASYKASSLPISLCGNLSTASTIQPFTTGSLVNNGSSESFRHFGIDS